MLNIWLLFSTTCLKRTMDHSNHPISPRLAKRAGLLQAGKGPKQRWVAQAGGCLPLQEEYIYIYICRGLDVLRVKADGGTSDFICVELDAVHLLRHLKRTEAALTSDLKTNQNLNTIKDGLTL